MANCFNHSIESNMTILHTTSPHIDLEETIYQVKQNLILTNCGILSPPLCMCVFYLGVRHAWNCLMCVR